MAGAAGSAAGRVRPARQQLARILSGVTELGDGVGDRHRPQRVVGLDANPFGRFGLRSFRYVNNEPWHVQPVEISTSRKHATVMPALVTWDLPGQPEPAPAPTVTFTLAGIHDEGDPMFIASKDGKYWIGNGLGRRVCADNADADFLIEKFKFASTPLINFQSGKPVTARDQVTGVPQMDRLGVNVEAT